MSLDAILGRQAGVISRRQALAAGLSPAAIDNRVRARRWKPLHPSVYLATNRVLDDEVRVHAALVWAGDDAVLSGRAAAWWWGMVEEAPRTIGVTVGRRRRVRRRVDIDMRRHDIPAPDRTVHRGLPITAPGMTVLDAVVESGEPGFRLLDTALQCSVPFREVLAAHRRNIGAAGAATAALMLADAVERSARIARRELLALLRRSGTTGWTGSLAIGGHAVDVAFPLARVAIVVAGWVPATDSRTADADARRWAVLVDRGWTLLRFTWHDIVERPEEVLAAIAKRIAPAMAVAGCAG